MVATTQGVVGWCSAESADGTIWVCSRCLVPDVGVPEVALPGDSIADGPTPIRLDLELPLLAVLLLRSMACRELHCMPQLRAHARGKVAQAACAKTCMKAGILSGGKAAETSV